MSRVLATVLCVTNLLSAWGISLCAWRASKDPSFEGLAGSGSVAQSLPPTAPVAGVLFWAKRVPCAGWVPAGQPGVGAPLSSAPAASSTVKTPVIRMRLLNNNRLDHGSHLHCLPAEGHESSSQCGQNPLLQEPVSKDTDSRDEGAGCSTTHLAPATNPSCNTRLTARTAATLLFPSFPSCFHHSIISPFLISVSPLLWSVPGVSFSLICSSRFNPRMRRLKPRTCIIPFPQVHFVSCHKSLFPSFPCKSTELSNTCLGPPSI